MTQDEIQDLVERAKGGDRPAFEALASRYSGHLESVIHQRLGENLRNRISTEDVRQETLLRAFRSIGRFEWQGGGDEGRSFFRWLSGIAVRVILEAVNSGKRERPFTLDFDAQSKEVSPSRTLARKERLERFEKALQGLSPDHRTVLRLVRIEKLSVIEAARRMNRSPNAVSLLIARALKKLRESFGETESLSLPRDWPAENGETKGS